LKKATPADSKPCSLAVD